MRLPPIRRFQSLKAKFVGFLLLGGMTAGAIGGWITHQATDAQLQQRLLIRVGTLASALNHAAMVTSDWSVVQHMIKEVIHDEPDIRDIMVADRSSLRIVAASMDPIVGHSVNELADEHLRRELLDALEHGHFGNHFESGHNQDQAGDLVVVAPLEPALATRGRHANHGTEKMPASDMSNQHAPAQELHGRGKIAHKTMAADKTQQSDIPLIRGAILIRVSRLAVERGASIVLWRYLVALFAAIGVILVIAYITLDYQVLGPVQSIHAAISQRKSGQSTARVSLRHHDEIAAVAQTLNETLDKEDEQMQALSSLLSQNEELRNRLQTSSNRFVEINERYLHRIGADLHDGPAQLIAFALLRLDSLRSILRKEYPDRESSKEISTVHDALHDAMREIRELSAGLNTCKTGRHVARHGF